MCLVRFRMRPAGPQLYVRFRDTANPEHWAGSRHVYFLHIFDVLTDKHSCCERLGVRFIMETLTTRVTTSAQTFGGGGHGGTVAGENRRGSHLTWTGEKPG